MCFANDVHVYHAIIELCFLELTSVSDADILIGNMGLKKSIMGSKGQMVKMEEDEGHEHAMCANDYQTDKDMFKALIYEIFCISL